MQENRAQSRNAYGIRKYNQPSVIFNPITILLIVIIIWWLA